MGRLIDQSFTVHDFLSLDWPVFFRIRIFNQRDVYTAFVAEVILDWLLVIGTVSVTVHTCVIVSPDDCKK
jgi:hypothetical protein